MALITVINIFKQNKKHIPFKNYSFLNGQKNQNPTFLLRSKSDIEIALFFGKQSFPNCDGNISIKWFCELQKDY